MTIEINRIYKLTSDIDNLQKLTTTYLTLKGDGSGSSAIKNALYAIQAKLIKQLDSFIDSDLEETESQLKI